MIDFDAVPYNQKSEQLVEVLMQKTQNKDPMFFRILVAYYMAKVASMMRCTIKTRDRGNVPVSLYAINLALSGHGKGHSTNIIEEQVIGDFRHTFLERTFLESAENNINQLAIDRANKHGTDPDEEAAAAAKEFLELGPLLFSFDSGTTPAVKQMRHKLLMADAGSMNMEIDEIGGNLMSNTEVLTTFLELFDVGKVKPKLIKNTKENVRNEEIHGRTPTNMMLFGTPTKLLDGSKTEEEFLSMLESGYARRCFFGYSRTLAKDLTRTAQEVLDSMTDTSSASFLVKLSGLLSNLANPVHFNKVLIVDEPTQLEILEYQLDCERRAAALPEHQEVQKAELTHRYFKALKLAGAYAFIDGSSTLTIDHFASAAKLAEDSGVCFKQILSREKNYVRLARYIAAENKELTHADIQEDLPFYGRGSKQDRDQMISLAIAWGYRNNVVIRRYLDGEIEFLKGESLKETNLDEMILSWSDDIAFGYRNELAPFTDLTVVTQQKGYHFINHHLTNGHRKEDNCEAGFNMVVLDVDDGVSVDTAKLLLQDYTYLIYTTKSHTEAKHRFRVILPLSHELELNPDDFKEFMNNIYDFLPFDMDRVTNQRARKWEANDGNFWYNQGQLFDVLPFIPKTKKAEETRQQIVDLGDLTNLERWFAQKATPGNRNNTLIRYALMLVDSGYDQEVIRERVISFNAKLKNKLSENEIYSTIMTSVNAAIIKKATQ